jgi:hypothetical protein
MSEGANGDVVKTLKRFEPNQVSIGKSRTLHLALRKSETSEKTRRQERKKKETQLTIP